MEENPDLLRNVRFRLGTSRSWENAYLCKKGPFEKSTDVKLNGLTFRQTRTFLDG